MPKIAIIDDNTDHSGTVQNNIEIGLAELGSSLEVISSIPFKDPKDYFNFIDRNEVCVLILDEMLNDQAIDENGPVDYKGSQLVVMLREQLKNFPIFALTVIPHNDELESQYSLYEDVISRDEFYKNSEKFIPKFLRAANNYLNDNLDELSQFNELTQEVSGGNSDPELLKKLQALQIKLELPFSGFDDRNAWLNEYEKQIKSLEELNVIINSKLAK